MFLNSLFALITFILISEIKCDKPNIVMILADDMGRNDVGIHGSSQIPTPNLDALASNGVILNSFYTMQTCTPSRAALLTGNHPIRSGMQGFPIMSGEPRALPLNMATMAERLLALGYNTHLVGKWHLGHENRSVLPLGRGFQSHLGIWNGFSGYFDYQIQDTIYNGFDLHRDYKTAPENILRYATDLYTDEANTIINKHNVSNPMFLLLSHTAPHSGKNGYLMETPTPLRAQFKYRYIQERKRRLYADMVNRLDTSVGKVVKTLQEKGILENTILIFMSDNGAQTTGLFNNFGSNWPYRGLKFTLYEGGVRNIGFAWGKMLKNRHYIEKTLFHITDWLPTLYAAAGGDISDLGQIDGLNHWPLLSTGTTEVSRTRDLLLNIDEKENYSGILSADGRYKLTQGSYQNGIYDDFYGDSGRENNPPSYDVNAVLNSNVNTAILSADASSPLTPEIILNLRQQLEIKQANASRTKLNCNANYCLFDLIQDPTETTDIATSQPDIVNNLITSLASYRAQLVPQTNKPVDAASNPIHCYYTWFTWKDPVHKCTI